MRLRQIFSQLLLIMSLPAILALQYNQVANWHYHVLSNGMVVEHAHPFQNKQQKGTPFQQHQHSDAEIALLTVLSNVLPLIVSFLVLAGLLLPVALPAIRRGHVEIFPAPLLITNQFRGPPSFSSPV